MDAAKVHLSKPYPIGYLLQRSLVCIRIVLSSCLLYSFGVVSGSVGQARSPSTSDNERIGGPPAARSRRLSLLLCSVVVAAASAGLAAGERAGGGLEVEENKKAGVGIWWSSRKWGVDLTTSQGKGSQRCRCTAVPLYSTLGTLHICPQRFHWHEDLAYFVGTST